MSIKVAQVSYIYNQGTTYAKTALKNISLEIKDNEILGIIGLEGSGKSTFLQILNGLIKPSSGKVCLDKIEINSLSPKELSALRQKIGLVFQNPEKQIFESRVFDEIAFGPHNLGIKQNEIAERVKKALKQVGLSWGCKDRLTNTLSSGEKRRVAIAGILALDPSYLLLDEPTSGLDYDASETIINSLRVLHREKRTTIVIVSHQLKQLLEICDRIMLLDEGSLVFLEETDILLKNISLLGRKNIKLPAFLELIDQLNKKGWDLQTRTRTPHRASLEIIQKLRPLNLSERDKNSLKVDQSKND